MSASGPKYQESPMPPNKEMEVKAINYIPKLRGIGLSGYHPQPWRYRAYKGSKPTP